MKLNHKIVWFDDSPEREAVAKSLAKAIGASLDFRNVKEKNLDQSLNEYLTDARMPDLIVIDHFLDNTASSTFRRGSTAATYIHETFPECPIISVTAVNIKDDVDTRQKSAYENMFPDNEISDHYQTILSIMKGFKKLRRKKPTTVAEIIKEFKCPDTEMERFSNIIPSQIKEKENLKDRSMLIEMYKWYKDVLIKRPGFLYDKTWTATHLGLTVKGFEEVRDKFDKALYTGVFADNSQERWWKSKITELVVKETGEVGLPWEIGRNLIDSKKFYSKCHSSSEPFPEIVAAEDETDNAMWYPMKLKNTEPHPSFEDMLFFEKLRIMK